MKRSVPPEGGWGYMVLVGMVFGFLAAFGYKPSLGLMFADFLADLGEQTKALTILPSFFYISFSPVGLFANYLLNRFSVRSVGVAGAVIYCAGSMALIFVRTLNQLVFVFSILQGIGCGLMLPVMYTTFNRYFVRRCVMMLALINTLNGVIGVFLPVCIEYLMQTFGFRGCMAILAAFNLHILFGMIAMHPVEWHQSANENRRSKIKDDSNEDELERETFLQEELPLETSNNQGYIKTFWNIIVDFLDLTLLSDPIYANICIGMSLTLFSDVTFCTIQPSYMYELGHAKMDTAMIVSIGASAYLVSLIVVTVISGFVQFRARHLFLAGVICTVATQYAFLTVSSFMGLAVLTAILGFFRAYIHVPVGIICAEYLPTKRFPAGYGLFMVIQGITIIVLGPVMGWIRDYTQSYPVAFYCNTLGMIACAVPWTIELLFLRRRQSVGRQEASI